MVPRWLVALFAAVLAVGGAPLRAALAGAGDATAHCCCGPHGADVDCGCPNCPASHAPQEADAHDDGAPGEMPAQDDHDVPRIRACGLTGDLATPIVIDLALAPRPHVRPVAPALRLAGLLRPPGLALGYARAPEPPPPRAA